MLGGRPLRPLARRPRPSSPSGTLPFWGVIHRRPTLLSRWRGSRSPYASSGPKGTTSRVGGWRPGRSAKSRFSPNIPSPLYLCLNRARPPRHTAAPPARAVAYVSRRPYRDCDRGPEPSLAGGERLAVRRPHRRTGGGKKHSLFAVLVSRAGDPWRSGQPPPRSGSRASRLSAPPRVLRRTGGSR